MAAAMATQQRIQQRMGMPQASLPQMQPMPGMGILGMLPDRYIDGEMDIVAHTHGYISICMLL
jgi:hypothetical protein